MKLETAPPTRIRSLRDNKLIYGKPILCALYDTDINTLQVKEDWGRVTF